MPDDLAMLSATELLRRYRARTLSPVEVTAATLSRIDALEPKLNAYRVVFHEQALASARESEARWMAGTPKGLADGVPTGVKDTHLLAGWPTLRGSRTTDPAGPWDEDAPPVARLREHGAVFLGKTTTPEFGWTGVTDSPVTGTTRNPWDLDRNPGGSSGGAGAAAAAGMGALHLGGDGGGSIRIPAALCGVYGLKGTWGRVPQYPYSISGSITHTGPMTRGVADAALFHTITSEPDARDWRALPPDGRDYRIGLEDGVQGLRIAYSPDLGFARVDPEYAEIVARAAQVFAELGATLDEATPDIGNPEDPFRVHYVGHMCVNVAQFTEEQRALLDPRMVAYAAEGARYSAADTQLAQRQREVIGRTMSLFHARWDLMVTPQMARPPLDISTPEAMRDVMVNWQRWSPFTYPFNWTGQPAASVPCGVTRSGLPVALQIVGPRGADALVLRASRAFESARPFAAPPVDRLLSA